MWISIVFFTLLLGYILFFYDEIKQDTRRARDVYQKSSIHLWQYLPRKKLTLKAKIHRLNFGKKANFIQTAYSNMSHILTATGEKEKINRMRAISALSGCFGIALSLYLQSFLLLPILGIGLALIPTWLIKFKAYRYNLRMQNELSVVLSMVTNSYIRNENIVKSVSENLLYMNEPVKSIFSSFVYANSFVNADISANLRLLKNKIDSNIFMLWCENLIMCQNDINQKYSLGAVVEQFTADKELYNLLSAETSKPMSVLFAIIACTSLAFPATYMLGQQFEIENIFQILFSTVPGQSIIIGYVFSILYAINLAIDLSTQID